MRRITFTQNVTLSAAFGYEEAVEEGVEPRMHSIDFKEGEVFNFYEWGYGNECTNFASDNPEILARVQPGDSTHDVVVILEATYDCHESEPAFEVVEEPFRVKTPVVASPVNPYHFLPNPGSLDDEDVVDFDPAIASTA